MKTTILLSSALAAVAVAQDQSKPFNLVVKSDDASIDGGKFVACHTGAAIESLCLYGNSGSEFYFNTTEGSQAPIEGYSVPGTLAWNLPIGEGYVSEPMDFSTDPSTNVALPLFQPGYDTTSVAFDRDENMAIFSYSDDTTETPGPVENPHALNNWYVCQTYYAGYQYQTLNWVMGKTGSEPQNPTCIKADVQRKFI